MPDEPRKKPPLRHRAAPLDPASSRLRIGVPIFTGIDLCQLAIAADTARALSTIEPGATTVLIVVASKRASVRSAQAIRILPDTSFEHCPQLDVLIVAGESADERRQPPPDAALVRFVRAQAPGLRRIVPVGSGAHILAAAGCGEVSISTDMTLPTTVPRETRASDRAEPGSPDAPCDTAGSPFDRPADTPERSSSS